MIDIEEIRKKESPFSVPSGYFQEMQQQLLSRTKIAASNDVQMSVPEDYFDTLQKKVLAETTDTARVVPLGKRRWWGVAASLMVLVGASMWLWPNTVADNDRSSIAALTTDESLELVAMMSDDFTLEDYAEFMTEEDMQSLLDESGDDLYLEGLDFDQLIELEKAF